MRIAIVDLLFSWPPHGGADVDVYHVARELQELGHEPRLFVTYDEATWQRGRVTPAQLPIPLERLDFAAGAMTAATLCKQATQSLHTWGPDVVLLTQGYFWKIPLITALKEYPVISRCYAHETACHKDILRFRDGAPCPHAYGRTPDICRRCALVHLAPTIKSGHHTPWTQEYLDTHAWASGYYGRFIQAMKQLHAVIITTEHMREQVTGLCDTIHVIPHGVDAHRFTPSAPKASESPPVLFVPGRIEDPAKGFDTVLEACRRLAREGRRFSLHATLPEGYQGPAWLQPMGKMDYDKMPEAYQNAAVCIVPSLWDEPFGIVALEAMACGVPVCASEVGGLQDIVIPNETGLLFARGDAAEMAAGLGRLLDNNGLRREMGVAARKRVLEHYHWPTLMARHYPTLLAGI